MLLAACASQDTSGERYGEARLFRLELWARLAHLAHRLTGDPFKIVCLIKMQAILGVGSGGKVRVQKQDCSCYVILDARGQCNSEKPLNRLKAMSEDTVPVRDDIGLTAGNRWVGQKGR